MSVLTVEDCLRTFTNWPESAPVSATDLAIAGFMYTGEDDRVECIYCRGLLHSWQPGDEPSFEHRRYFPHCPSIDEDYIPYDIAPLERQVDPIEEPVEAVPIEVPVETVAESLLCRVCLTTERDIVLMPWFHLVLCGSCLSRLTSCPVCRQTITGSMKVYLS